MKLEFKAFVSSGIMQVKQQLHQAIVRFMIFIQPVLYGFIMYMMFRAGGNENFVAYVILGTGMMNLWSTIVFSSATTIDRERHIGTLEIISAAPVGFRTAILGKIVGSVVLGLISTINGYIFIIIISGEKMTIAHPVLFIFNLIIIIISYIMIALVLAALFSLSRQARQLTNASEHPIYILSGFIFPITVLPVWTRPLSYLLSPTWGVKTLRLCVMGIDDMSQYQLYMGILILITIAYYIISKILFAIILKKIRIKGTLGVA